MIPRPRPLARPPGGWKMKLSSTPTDTALHACHTIPRVEHVPCLITRSARLNTPSFVRSFGRSVGRSVGLSVSALLVHSGLSKYEAELTKLAEASGRSGHI